MSKIDKDYYLTAWLAMKCLEMPAAGQHSCITPDGIVTCENCRYDRGRAGVI